MNFFVKGMMLRLFLVKAALLTENLFRFFKETPMKVSVRPPGSQGVLISFLFPRNPGSGTIDVPVWHKDTKKCLTQFPEDLQVAAIEALESAAIASMKRDHAVGLIKASRALCIEGLIELAGSHEGGRFDLPSPVWVSNETIPIKAFATSPLEDSTFGLQVGENNPIGGPLKWHDADSFSVCDLAYILSVALEKIIIHE